MHVYTLRMYKCVLHNQYLSREKHGKRYLHNPGYSECFTYLLLGLDWCYLRDHKQEHIRLTIGSVARA